MENQIFHSDIDRMFESYLQKEDEPRIMIIDLEKNQILNAMDYSRVFFDKTLNIYKIEKDGAIKKVDNPNFRAVVVKV